MGKGLFKSSYWLVIFSISVGFLMNACHRNYTQNASVFSIIPVSTPLFVKINDPVTFTQSLGKQNNWWNMLGSIESMEPLNRNISTLDSLINSNQDFKNFFVGKEVVVSFFPARNKALDLLLIIPLANSSEQKKAESFIEGFNKKELLNRTKRKFNRKTLFEVKSFSNEVQYGYAFVHNFLIVSKNTSLIEETLSHLENKKEEPDKELAPLLKTTNNQTQLNIFVNHRLAGEMLSFPLSEKMKERNNRLTDFSGWSELDATIKDEKIILSGFSNGDPKQNYLASVLQNQQPGISKIESVLPANTAFLSGYFISDIEKFIEDIDQFQSKKGAFDQRLTQQKQIEAKTGVNLQRLFTEIFDGEMSRSGIFVNPNDQKPSVLFTLKTKSGSFTLDKLNELIRAYLSGNSTNQEELIKEFKIDNQTSYPIYKFPIQNFASLLFGDMLGEVQTNWFTLYNNYLIFSDSYSALGKIILSNMLGETLLSDNEYSKFQTGLASKNNYYFYCNTSICFSRANLFFNDAISNDIATNEEFRKFRHFSWQVSSAGDMLYTNSSTIYDQHIKFKPQTVWQSHLAAPIAMKPMIIENSYDLQRKEIVLFDYANNLYLLNNVGRIVWQLNTGSPILGEINLITFNKNGDYQLVFNTKEKLFVIDTKGNHAKNFPINFKINATNGLAVFDYENNRNYRFFFASEDQFIYAYDQEGSPVEGWQPYKTDHVVTNPLQHFLIEGKDYIVASDRMKDYIFDRKGNIRVKTDFVYQHSEKNSLYLEKRTKQHDPRMVSTDSEGTIHRTYFDGRHEVIPFKQLDDTHFFVAANVNEDEELEYIFTQANQIGLFRNSGEPIFELKMNEKTLAKPGVFHFSPNDKKIGVTSVESNKIYLLNNVGSVYKGFPLDGCTDFNIGFFSDDRSRFNLWVGSPDGYLYNYLIE
jgi:hypothetical protein